MDLAAFGPRRARGRRRHAPALHTGAGVRPDILTSANSRTRLVHKSLPHTRIIP